MKDASATVKPQAIHLRDYRPVPWAARASSSTLSCTMTTPASSRWCSTCPTRPPGRLPALVLNGIDLETESVRVDGVDYDYAISDVVGGQELSLSPPNRPFALEIIDRIKPQENTTMEGLYRSGEMFCTQMEAEGFRRVVWHLDRPDVLSTWTVTMTADKAKYPVLLCNGNLVESWDEPVSASGVVRHGARWHDPHLQAPLPLRLGGW